MIQAVLQIRDADQIDFFVRFEYAKAIPGARTVVVSDDIVGGDAGKTITTAAQLNLFGLLRVLFVLAVRKNVYTDEFRILCNNSRNVARRPSAK